MIRKRCLSAATILAGLLLVPGSPAGAEEVEGSFTGRFLVGFRSVDVGGRVEKFREDINLDDGPRLFELSFDFVPEEGLRSFADRVQLDFNNLGGDPFESFRLGIQKSGAFDFRYRRTESTYFYEDIILPPSLASISGSTGGDFHHFDFERVRDTADLSITLSRAAQLNFGFERFTKRGESTTTLDISRDEFELDRPIEESLNTYSGGFQYAWDKVTLVIEERIRDYENVVEIFLPGFSLGENPTGAELDFFFLDQPYDFTSLEHGVRLLIRPNRRLDIRLSALLQDLDLDVAAEETSQGIDFRGNPFTTDLDGRGEIDRDLELYDVDFSYLVSDRLAVVGGLRQHELDQDGEFLFGSDFNVGRWRIDTTSVEAGVEIAVSPQLTVTGAATFESREAEFAQTEEGDELEREREETDRDGYFVTVGWRPSKAFELTAALEDNSFDDPFTLASPTDRERYRLRGQYRWDNGVSLTGIYRLTDYENTNSGWEAETEQTGLRLGYRKEGLDLSLGYNKIDIEREIDQLVDGIGSPRTDLFAIFYDADSDFFDGRVRWTASDRVALGADLRLYENDGSFALEREDYRVFAEIGFAERYLLHLGYRTVDYDEDAFDFDDYDADIAEVSIGYRF